MYGLQAPFSDSLCDLGQVIHHLWTGEATGEAQGSSVQWGQAIRVGASVFPTSQSGQLVAGAGRVAKETGHHPSRRPGSVLNCLLLEA